MTSRKCQSGDVFWPKWVANEIFVWFETPMAPEHMRPRSGKCVSPATNARAIELVSREIRSYSGRPRSKVLAKSLVRLSHELKERAR